MAFAPKLRAKVASYLLKRIVNLAYTSAAELSAGWLPVQGQRQG